MDRHHQVAAACCASNPEVAAAGQRMSVGLSNRWPSGANHFSAALLPSTAYIGSSTPLCIIAPRPLDDSLRCLMM